MTKTLIALDFDGVVSPIDHDKEFLESEGWITFNFGLPCSIHTRVLEFLKVLEELSSSDAVDVYWASSWNKQIEGLSLDSGGQIPEFPWIPVHKGKGDAIFETAKSGGCSRIITLDDHARVGNRVKLLAKEFPEIEVLAIAPKVRKGITDSHIKRVKDFLSGS